MENHDKMTGESGDKDDWSVVRFCLTTGRGSSGMIWMTLENNWHFPSDRTGLNNQVVSWAGSRVSGGDVQGDHLEHSHRVLSCIPS